MFENQIFNINDTNFLCLANSIFQYQKSHNQVYKFWVHQLKKSDLNFDSICEFPFLPISAFKTNKVVCNYDDALFYKIFKSSGTTQGEHNRSQHFVSDLKIYEISILLSFHKFIGKIQSRPILALLPSYIENSDSSLIYMVNYLMQLSQHPRNRFYNKNFKELYKDIHELVEFNEDIVLFSVSFALIDFVNQFSCSKIPLTVINTGGLKGRQHDIELSELKDFVFSKAPLFKFFEEYSMCELLSQAYTNELGNYLTPAWMKVLVADVNNPLEVREYGKGQIYIIDLANFNSCSFIATEDYGEIFEDGSFKILGRIHDNELRGCSQLIL